MSRAGTMASTAQAYARGRKRVIEINAERWDLRWLLNCPVGDENFQLAVKRAGAETLRKALASLPEEAKSKRAAIERALSKTEGQTSTPKRHDT